MDPKVVLPYKTRHRYTGGRVKGLLIGIDYLGTDVALQGCSNDVRMILATLEHIQFPFQQVIVLVDSRRKFPGTAGLPTKANILKYMKWLVHGARPGDTLFLHYSGHGSQQRHRDGHGMYEVLIPLDYKRAGVITDQEIYQICVDPLPAGVRLTAVMDCCHSGTLMDLPFVFEMSRTGKVQETKKKGWFSGGQSSRKSKSKSMTEPETKVARFRRTNRNFSRADVILFSGCADSQKSSDVRNMTSFKTALKNTPGLSGGACTGALSQAFAGTTGLSVVELLLRMRRSLQLRRFTQYPQLSSTKPIDMKKPFSMFGSLAKGAQGGHVRLQQNPLSTHSTLGLPPSMQTAETGGYQHSLLAPLVHYPKPKQISDLAPLPFYIKDKSSAKKEKKKKRGPAPPPPPGFIPTISPPAQTRERFDQVPQPGFVPLSILEEKQREQGRKKHHTETRPPPGWIPNPPQQSHRVTPPRPPGFGP